MPVPISRFAREMFHLRFCAAFFFIIWILLSAERCELDPEPEDCELDSRPEDELPRLLDEECFEEEEDKEPLREEPEKKNYA